MSTLWTRSVHGLRRSRVLPIITTRPRPLHFHPDTDLRLFVGATVPVKVDPRCLWGPPVGPLMYPRSSLVEPVRRISTSPFEHRRPEPGPRVVLKATQRPSST